MPCAIQMASHLSGLTTHVIRIWERRYGAMSPTRTDSNRRLYCEEAIKRLKLLRQLTEVGHRIGNVAKLPTEDLELLLDQHLQRTLLPRTKSAPDAPLKPLEDPKQFVDLCMAASKAFDSETLHHLFKRARHQLGQRGMLHHVICPLIQKIGDSWQAGNLRPGQEHLATSVIREVLMMPVPGSVVAESAPELVITTPSGETHELGAMLVAASARDLGWKVTYLGPNLPSEEIAACATARQARAVALSLVYPENCPNITGKVRQLRGLLPKETTLIIGGRAAEGYKEQLSDLDIHWAHCLNGLDNLLTQATRLGAARE
jgi:MerR family transcriptional regulator, light-induced transcriptional regulator